MTDDYVLGTDAEELRRLFYYLVDTVLERSANTAPSVVDLAMPSALPLIARS